MVLSKSGLLVNVSTSGPVFIQAVFIVLLAYAAARLTWLVYDSVAPVGSVELLSPSVIQSISSPSRRVAVSDLVGQNLFGRVQSTPVVDAVMEHTTSIPATRLKLRLLGVFASDEIHGTRAIIANSAGKERTYSVGDILAGNAVVDAIYADRVVITHNGRKEVLRILWDGSAAPRSQKSAALSPSMRIPPDIAVFRDALFQGTDKLKQALGAKPVREGNAIVGFRVNEAASRAAARFGVRPGDVLMTVNGVRLDSEASLNNLLKRIPTTRKYQVQLKRNGRIKDITIGQ